jgi:hypothetical protein
LNGTDELVPRRDRAKSSFGVGGNNIDRLFLEGLLAKSGKAGGLNVILTSAAFVPPFSFGGPLLRLCVGLGRFEGSDAWQRDRWRLSIAGAALEPVIKLCWLDPVDRVCFAHVVPAYIVRSIRLVRQFPHQILI